jgi:hypothetical protein
LYRKSALSDARSLSPLPAPTSTTAEIGDGKWHKRWFSLKGNGCLYFYKTDKISKVCFVSFIYVEFKGKYSFLTIPIQYLAKHSLYL